jgi:hypothetical protein
MKEDTLQMSWPTVAYLGRTPSFGVNEPWCDQQHLDAQWPALQPQSIRQPQHSTLGGRVDAPARQHTCFCELQTGPLMTPHRTHRANTSQPHCMREGTALRQSNHPKFQLQKQVADAMCSVLRPPERDWCEACEAADVDDLA